jgi:hypothetical protein
VSDISLILILSLSKDEDAETVVQTSSFDKLRMRFLTMGGLRES